MTKQQEQKHIKEVSEAIVYQINNCVYGITCNYGALVGKIGVNMEDIIKASQYLVTEGKAEITINMNSYFSKITLK